MQANRLDFAALNRQALAQLPVILNELLPGGMVRGQEYTARNPTRADRRAGSFRINLQSGRWADFATGDAGGDVVSLVAYLRQCSQGDAARWLRERIGGGDGTC
jgi:hypothetical protein